MLTILIHKIISLFLMMGAGFLLAKAGVLTGADGRSLSKLCCNLIIPCSVFSAFQVDRSPQVLRGLGLVVLAAVLLHLAMLLVLRMIRRPLGLTPVEQASVVYTNAGNLIIPLVSAMLGPEWVIYTSGYILAMTVLTWSHGKALVCGDRTIPWLELLRNPNVLGILSGGVLFLLGLRLPALLGDTIFTVGTMVGPISMLIIGVTMGNQPLGRALAAPRVWLAAGLRLLFFPALCLGLLKLLCLVFPEAGPYLMVTMMSAAAPSAAVITQICQIHGQDSGDASAICTVTTLLCGLTIPLMIRLYMLFCL